MSESFLLSVLLLVSPLSGLAIRVLSSGQDVATHQPEHSGVELLHSSLAGQDTVTICFRFITYQFTHQDYEMGFPLQMLLMVKNTKTIIFGSAAMTEELPKYKAGNSNWKNGNILLYDINGASEVIDWKPGVWNYVCITLSASTKIAQYIFNGKEVARYENYDGLHYEENHNLVLMAWYEEGNYAFPLFGAMTDANIWNRYLTVSEVEQWSRCEGGTGGGNLLDWNSAHWDLVGTGIREMEMDEDKLCEEQEDIFVASANKLTFQKTLKFCKSIGGRMATASNPDIMQKMLNAVLTVIDKDNDNEMFYAGFSEKYEEGIFVNVNTDERLSRGGWLAGYPSNSSQTKDCALFSRFSNGAMFDDSCNLQNYPICNVPKMTVFQLQGVGLECFIDRFYVLQSDKELLGFMHTKMVWADKWEIIDLITNTVAAYVDDLSEFSLPIGVHSWRLTNNSGCSGFEEGEMTTKLSFHLQVPQPGKFCCDDGVCIDSDLTCDIIPDCNDKSDELRCDIVQPYEATHNSNSPPLQNKEDGAWGKAKIESIMIIMQILDINVEDQLFSVVFQINLEWKDQRLFFQYLKKDKLKNRILLTNLPDVWHPKLKYMTAIELATVDESLFIERRTTPQIFPHSDALHPNESYPGDQNGFVKKYLMQAKFNCEFDNIKSYPFGLQECWFVMFISGPDNGITDLNSKNLTYYPQKRFSQFIIRGWSVKSVVSGDFVGLQYRVQLSRDLVSILLVTYVPTILINIINQVTNYISSNKYDMIITVNITCMMVLSGIYLSVSNSLPTTATIKPVEVWLLFSLIYPGLVILFNIFIQREKDQDATENHNNQQISPLLKIGRIDQKLSKFRRNLSKLELITYCLLPTGYFLFAIVYIWIFCILD